jgi:cell wall-associated NlpC family hydrolase
MGHKVRREAYRAFIDANFVDTPQAPVFTSKGTNCAIFARGCLTQAGVMPMGRRPKVTAITTWLGVRGFAQDDPDTEAIEGAWIPLDELDGLLLPGDVLFWTGWQGQRTIGEWGGTTNGHVGIVLFDGDGWMVQTAEGGGPNHLCRKSDAPKDVRLSGKRPLRGVWRPSLLVKP